jgi:hypothetical protein
MSEDCKFWLNFGIQVFIGLATFGAVLAALFGRWFQDKFRPPVLRMRIANPNGERRLSRNGQPTTRAKMHRQQGPRT